MRKIDYIKLLVLWGGAVFSAGLAFVAQVLLAKSIGTETYGVFSSALGVISILIPLGALGVPQYWLQLYGKFGWLAVIGFRKTEKMVWLGVGGVVALIIINSVFFYSDDVGNKINILLIPYAVGQVLVEVVFSKLQLEEKYYQVSIWQVVPSVIRLLSVVLSVSLFSGSLVVYFSCFGYAISGLVVAVFAAKYMAQMRRNNFELKGHGLKPSAVSGEGSNFDPVLSQIISFATANFLYLVYFQIGLPMVRYIAGNHQAGIYGAAVVVMSGIVLIPGVVYQKYLLPKMHRWANIDSEQDKLFSVHRKGSFLMVSFGALIGCILFLFSEYIVVVYGDQYIDLIPVLRVYALYVPIAFAASSYGAMLTAINKINLRVKAMGVCAVATIGLNCFLIESHGAIGAVISQIVSSFLMVVLFYIFIRNSLMRGQLK